MQTSPRSIACWGRPADENPSPPDLKLWNQKNFIAHKSPFAHRSLPGRLAEGAFVPAEKAQSFSSIYRIIASAAVLASAAASTTV